MYLDSLAIGSDRRTPVREQAAPAPAPILYGVDSEYGRLRSVLLADAGHLALVPCNTVSAEAFSRGRATSPLRAARQHAGLVAALKGEGVEVRLAPAAVGLPDLAFTRDTSLMTPWGLLGLRPGAPHRVGEVDEALAAARAGGVPILGRIEEGRIEGGDIAMLRPGVLAVGVSGDRTDDAGAAALARIYEARGWRVIRTRFDPEHLHLDTIFASVDKGLALACPPVLDAAFLEAVAALGIAMLPVTPAEARGLGCNLLALGDRRVVTAGSCSRIDAALAGRGYRAIAVDLSEFTMCGGGAHCLTMPLARDPG